MSIDLLGLVKDQLTSAAMGKISEFLGESSQNTQSAIGAAMPTILGGLMEKASTTEGAGSLLGMLNKDGHDGSLLGGLGDMLGSSDGISGLLSGGSGIISSIFGDKVGGIVELIANVSGIKKSSSSSLLSMAAPILMGVLGKQVTSQGLGISGLANLLMGQKDAVKAALPAGAGSLLNIAGLGDFLGGAKSSSNSSVSNDEETTGGGFNFWPWLIAAALALGAWYFLKSCKGNDATAVTDSLAVQTEIAGDSLSSMASAVGDSAASTIAAVGDMFSKKLSSGFEIKGASTGIENSLISFIEDGSKAVDKTTWFNFDNMLFDTGKSTIKPESQVQITNLVEILKAFPNVSLKIGGYTDNVGDAKSNLKLSADRAAAVVAALKAAGIDGKRLESEGYGQEHPVASNDTEEGRTQNRRIAARVTAK
jgi:OmpA-OmpF porin, OOP family